MEVCASLELYAKFFVYLHFSGEGYLKLIFLKGNMVLKSLSFNLYISCLYPNNHSTWAGKVGVHTTDDSDLKGPENSWRGFEMHPLDPSY